MLGVLFVHSLPEGFAIGTAFASEREGLGLFILLAIALQNIPEGTASAIPMQEAGFPAWQQFWAAVATSAPQPLGAVVAYLLVEQIEALLPSRSRSPRARCSRSSPWSWCRRRSRARTWRSALAGAAAGAVAMLALSAASASEGQAGEGSRSCSGEPAALPVARNGVRYRPAILPGGHHSASGEAVPGAGSRRCSRRPPGPSSARR